jgi:hypothetical protein
VLNRAAAVIGTLALATAVAGTWIGTADAAGTTTTLHLNATLDTGKHLDKTHLVSTGTLTFRELSRRGKPAGVISFTCHNTSTTGVLLCRGAYVLRRGILLARSTVNFNNGTLNGTITGGDGAYGGARGTVTGQSESSGVTIINLHFTY